MAPKEPTRAQLSSKLSYQHHTPVFLQKLKNKFAGISDDEDEEDEEFEHVGGGRPPIPKRPAIPERPADDPGSADEDDGDEKPQVVVLREGKHLTEREAENVRRKEKGLSLLPDPEEIIQKLENPSPSLGKGQGSTSKSQSQSQGLSFSSSKKSGPKSSAKRKAVGQPDGDKDDDKDKKSSKKKAKKSSKTLLSFGDDT